MDGFVKKVIELFADSLLTEMEVEKNDLKLKLKKDSSSRPLSKKPPAPQTSLPPPYIQTSNSVGTFKTIAKINDTVRKNQLLGYIECLKVPSEIEAKTDGKIIEIFVQDSEAVEYDQLLFLIQPPS